MSTSLNIKELRYLNQRALNSYERFKAIKDEKKRLEARIKELDEAWHREDEVLKEQFEEGNGARRIPGGIILSRRVVIVPDKIITPEMVGSLATRGYQYPLYKEIEG